MLGESMWKEARKWRPLGRGERRQVLLITGLLLGGTVALAIALETCEPLAGRGSSSRPATSVAHPAGYLAPSTLGESVCRPQMLKQQPAADSCLASPGRPSTLRVSDQRQLSTTNDRFARRP